MTVIIAIDCGTTSTRAIAFDESGAIIHQEQRALKRHCPRPDWVEHDPHDLWIQTRDCLDQIIAQVTVPIHAIGLTNQRETALVWQKSSGKPLGPAISWQCRRTAAMCQQYDADRDRIKAKTGLLLDPYFSATKFKWHCDTVSDIAALMHQKDICFGTVDSWLLWHLTNGDTFATDITNASRTLLVNIHTGDYDADLCAMFGIPTHSLPRIMNSADDYGVYTSAKGPIPIHGVLGDQQAALFAHCGRRSGVIKNTYGTGLFVMANTGSTPIQSPDLLTTVAIGINGTVDYALEGSVFTGMDLLRWLQESMGLVTSPNEATRAAMSVPDNGGVTIIPALSGLGAPHWQPHATGCIMGLTQHTQKAHILRAAFEAIALQVNDIVALFRHESTAWSTMIVDGGGSVNDWLMQLQADIVQLMIQRPPCIEATAWGAARCAALWTNHWPDVPDYPPTLFEPMARPTGLLKQWNHAFLQYHKGM
jgi:glycerol kinase